MPDKYPLRTVLADLARGQLQLAAALAAQAEAINAMAEGVQALAFALAATPEDEGAPQEGDSTDVVVHTLSGPVRI